MNTQFISINSTMKNTLHKYYLTHTHLKQIISQDQLQDHNLPIHLKYWLDILSQFHQLMLLRRDLFQRA